MKLLRSKPLPHLRILSATLALALAGGYAAHAHPYASGITGTNGAGYVSFIMNEGGANVTVTFEDSSTLNMGVLPKGQTNFFLGNHTSYTITCFKQGNGVPVLISDDTFTNSVWTNATGCAVNHNPKVGSSFGRVYAANWGAFPGPAAKLPGIYAMNADQTFVAYCATNPSGNAWAGGGYTYFKSPGRIRVAPDNTLLVADGRVPGTGNRVYQYAPDLSSSWVLLGPSPATTYGDLFGTPVAVGSLAEGNLVLYTASAGEGAPGDTNCILGPLTSPGSYNCIFRYNIGAGPLPWNKRPDYAYTVGLDGIATLRPEVDVESDGTLIAAFGRANYSNPNIQILRPPPTTNGITGDPANAAIQTAAKDATNWLYTSGVTPPFNSPPATDPWNGTSANSGGASGTFGGVRTSPDGQYFASIDGNNGVTVANLTNGIPNDGTIFGIVNGSSSGYARGIDWDAADNLWTITSTLYEGYGTPGQSKLRCYSLGLTTTCVTSNDWTGTNGSFTLKMPPVHASLAVVNPNASQNYVNNTVNPGTPIPGVFRISLNTSDTTATGPVAVGFVLSGSAAYTANYTINTNETPNGVTITPNSVIFPAGPMPGGGNWYVDVKITPTALPVSGPTLTCNLRLTSGANYSAIAPLNGSIAILNTGPQLLQLSAASPSTLGGMNRGVPNDYARFVITRLGDTNGPGNDAVHPVVQRSFTVTTFNFGAPSSGPNFLAHYGVDYTAGPQNFTGSVPVDGTPGIVINPGDVTVPAIIGNPVKHTDTSLVRTNLQVIINLTNVCDNVATPGCNTNVTSPEGYAYQVTTTALTLNEYDNAVGGEVVLWSNPLTNAADSANWTLVYASIVQGSSPTLPLVVSNYDNSATGPGAYTAWFGKPVSDPGNDGGVTVPPSAAMLANGWSTALKVSVNKDPSVAGESGVNLYPQNLQFAGNYALRFDMFLSLYDYGLNNPTIGTPAREFAAFGINHYGTNANWRLDINPRQDGTGAYPINADGEWCVIGAASGSITPADYDMFISPAWATFDAHGTPLTNTIPYTTNLYVVAPFTNAYQTQPSVYSGATNFFANAGVPNDQQSANNNAFGGAPQNGIIKNPPFSGINKLGGAPDNAWVDVSLELTRQTNLTLKVAQQEIFHSSITAPTSGTQNPLAPFNGKPMLGYIDPNGDVSDYSAFVYFSNVRVVELSPFIPWTNQPVAGLIVTQGASFTLSSGALYASNPLTNIWNVGLTNGAPTLGNPESFTAKASIATNIFYATNGIGTLTINNLQFGTNYNCTWSDQAGSITSYRTVVEVIRGPGDQLVNPGATAKLTVTPSGNQPPSSYHWMFYGTNIANNTHYAGATTATLTINNVTAADAGVYSNVVVNAFGSVVATGGLTVVGGITPATQTALWGSPAQFTISDSGGSTTYQWKRNNVNLADGGHIVGSSSTTLTLNPVTTADAGTYTVGETNGTFGGIIGSGILQVVVPPPTITSTLVSGGNVKLSFTSTNSYDTTNAFILQTSPLVKGPYTNVPGAIFTGGNGAFNISIPQTSEPSRFYRLQHTN